MFNANSICVRDDFDLMAVYEARAEYALTVDSLQSQLAELDLGLGYDESPRELPKLTRPERTWLRAAAKHYKQYKSLSPAALAQARHLSSTRDCVLHLTKVQRRNVDAKAKAFETGIPPYRPSIGQLFNEARDGGYKPDIPVADARHVTSFDDVMGTTGEHASDDYETGIMELMFDD